MEIGRFFRPRSPQRTLPSVKQRFDMLEKRSGLQPGGLAPQANDVVRNSGLSHAASAGDLYSEFPSAPTHRPTPAEVNAARRARLEHSDSALDNAGRGAAKLDPNDPATWPTAKPFKAAPADVRAINAKRVQSLQNIAKTVEEKSIMPRAASITSAAGPRAKNLAERANGDFWNAHREYTALKAQAANAEHCFTFARTESERFEASRYRVSSERLHAAADKVAKYRAIDTAAKNAADFEKQITALQLQAKNANTSGFRSRLENQVLAKMPKYDALLKKYYDATKAV